MSEPEERESPFSGASAIGSQNHSCEHIRLTLKKKEAILSLISRLRTYEIRKALVGSMFKLELHWTSTTNSLEDNRLRSHKLRHLSREISKILGQIYSLLNAYS